MPIIHEFLKYIVLFKRYVDDILLIWSGPVAELCRFRAKFGTLAANIYIKLEWQGTPSATDAEIPAKFNQRQHCRVIFLDIKIVSLHGSPMFEFRIYRKPGSTYSYLLYRSYHAQHVFQGWLEAEVQRLLTHFSNPSVRLEECRIFYKHLQDRGYPVKAIDSTFRVCSSNWNQRRKMLEPKTKSGGAATGKHKSLAQ